MKHPFKLKNAALLLALAAIYPLVAHSAAGVAQFAVGDVNVRRGATSLPLSKGQAIDSGDNIVTGNSGQTQIRFSDGGLVSLSPNSQFNINKYVDDNDPTKDSFAVSFLRGGMRAITGLIGKRNRDNYKVTTNTATIGIRGSAFSARHNPDGSLDVAGEQDGIEVCTKPGCVSLIVGEMVRVTSDEMLPRRTADRSNVPPLAARADLFTPTNPPSITPPTLPNQPTTPDASPTPVASIAAMFVTGDGIVMDFEPRGDSSYGGSALFLGNQLTQHDDGLGGYNGSSVFSAQSPVTHSGALGSPTDADFIGWGYWAQGFASGSIHDGALADVHYLAGRPTPAVQMPVSGSASYALAGGTRPTATDTSGTLVGTLVSASMSASFTNGHGTVDASVSTQFTRTNGSTVNVTVSDLAFITGSSFRSVGCGNGNISGFFTGNQAARAGLIYSRTGTAVGRVTGAAVFTKNSSVPD